MPASHLQRLLKTKLYWWRLRLYGIFHTYEITCRQNIYCFVVGATFSPISPRCPSLSASNRASWKRATIYRRDLCRSTNGPLANLPGLPKASQVVIIVCRMFFNLYLSLCSSRWLVHPRIDNEYYGWGITRWALFWDPFFPPSLAPGVVEVFRNSTQDCNFLERPSSIFAQSGRIANSISLNWRRSLGNKSLSVGTLPSYNGVKVGPTFTASS
jgi:hypothetical protein